MNSDRPVVSIIIPAYNATDYIGEAIESVRDQTYTDWELIIVNDGSTDETPTIAESFCKIDSRIKLISQENGKLAKARNAGIGTANGNFIAFLDADDVWRSDKLKRELDSADRHKADVTFTGAYDLNDQSANKDVAVFGRLSGPFSGSDMFRVLYGGNKIPVSSVLIRKSERLLAELKFDEDPAVRGVEDYEMWLRLAASGALFLGLSEKITGYRQHEGQMSQRVTSMMKSTIAARRKHRATAERIGIDVRLQERIDQRNLAYCSCNEGDTQETWRSISALCDFPRFGLGGVGAAFGATLHAIYHFVQKPLRSRG